MSCWSKKAESASGRGAVVTLDCANLALFLIVDLVSRPSQKQQLDSFRSQQPWTYHHECCEKASE
eukprot:767417-Hanusia_phi.AAC.1